jgi:hypothetical protein
MHVRVERRFQVRVAENCLRRLHGFAHLGQQRRVGMSEGMPRNPTEPDAVAGWCEHAVVEVCCTERRSRRGAKNQVLGTRPSAPEFVRLQVQSGSTYNRSRHRRYGWV